MARGRYRNRDIEEVQELLLISCDIDRFSSLLDNHMRRDANFIQTFEKYYLLLFKNIWLFDIPQVMKYTSKLFQENGQLILANNSNIKLNDPILKLSSNERKTELLTFKEKSVQVCNEAYVKLQLVFGDEVLGLSI